MKILSNLTHLLASSRPPRSLSALLTGQLWKRCIIILPAAMPVMERTWCSRCRSETASTRGSPSATCSRWTPGGGPADTAPGPRCPGTPDTRDTADVKIFLYNTKIFSKHYSYYTCVMSPWATTPPCSSAAAASSEECAGTAAPITLPPVKLYHQSSLSPNPDPEYTQSRVIKVKC